MGAGYSSQMQTFSEKVLGTSVAMLSPKLDTALTYKPLSDIDVNDDKQKHCLPPLTDKPDPNATIDTFVELYSNYLNENSMAAISNYVEHNIMDTPEHLNAFMKMLIARLEPGGTSRLRPSEQATFVQQVHQVQQPSPTTEGVNTYPQPALTDYSRYPETPSVRSSRTSRSSYNAQLSTRSAVSGQNYGGSSYRHPVQYSSSYSQTRSQRQSPQSKPVPQGRSRLQQRMQVVDQAIGNEALAYERARQVRAETLAAQAEPVQTTPVNQGLDNYATGQQLDQEDDLLGHEEQHSLEVEVPGEEEYDEYEDQDVELEDEQGYDVEYTA